MTKLEKLREALAKANITLSNARRRKSMLEDRIKKEEQRELQSLMNDRGLSLNAVRELLAGFPAKTGTDAQDGYHGGETE